MYSSASDTELVEASRTGSRDAFAQIVERYQNLVCGVTYSATREVASSEDIAQETFLEAWQNLGKLNEPSRLRAWLCGIARNLSHNFLRRQLRNPVSRSLQLDTVADIAHSQPTPLDAVITAEEQHLLSQAVEALPETYREPLVLFYRQEQSMRAVAEALEISEDAARQRVNRARQLLRAEMALVVERGLVRTRAGKGFTTAVVAALPAIGIQAALLAGGTATAAAAGKTSGAGVAGKGAAAAYGLAAGLPGTAAVGALGGLLGGVAGVAGAWLGYRASYNQARSTTEQKFFKKAAVLIGTFTTTLVLVEGLLPLAWFRWFHRGATHIFAATAVAAMLVYIVGLTILLLWMVKTHRRILREVEPNVVPKYPGLMFRKWNSPRTTVYASLGGAIFGTMSGAILLEIIQAHWTAACLLILLTVTVYLVAVQVVLRRPDRYFAAGGWACLALGTVAILVFRSGLHNVGGAEAARKWGIGGQWAIWYSAVIVAVLGVIFLLLDYRGGKSGLRRQLAWRLATDSSRTSSADRTLIKSFSPATDQPETNLLLATESDLWRYDATGPMELRLFTIPGKQAGPCALFYTARLKTIGLAGHAWLQMQLRVKGNDYFSRGHILHESIGGDQDWTSVEIPFFLNAGQVAESVSLQLLVNGPGTVQIADVALAVATLRC